MAKVLFFWTDSLKYALVIVLVVFSRFLCSFVPSDTSFALYENRTKHFVFVFRRSDQGPVILWSPRVIASMPATKPITLILLMLFLLLLFMLMFLMWLLRVMLIESMYTTKR